MLLLFLKIILRSLKMGLKLLFIDETGMQIDNNNYYRWRLNNQLVFGEAYKDTKTRLNLILGIDKEKIIHYHFTYDTIDTNEMKTFFNGLLKNLGHSKTEYIIIMDNASYHVTDEIKNYLLQNKMKITNCPYYQLLI